jgi:hypothetical protein
MSCCDNEFSEKAGSTAAVMVLLTEDPAKHSLYAANAGDRYGLIGIILRTLPTGFFCTAEPFYAETVLLNA